MVRSGQERLLHDWKMSDVNIPPREEEEEEEEECAKTKENDAGEQENNQDTSGRCICYELTLSALHPCLVS
ncbi:unnamed protein product [Brugia pahangi]|uniref:Uncharacterized protein n=1 Tax=Brugia pahangi TaxID=6280 RepID=A0A0N4U093_BRUPA|nr:unnamed protein product [Brugia pahangi]